MQISITNPTMLKQVLGEIAERAINAVSQDIYDKENDRGRLYANILADTYEADGEPNHYYLGGSGKPSYEFLNTWDWTKTVNTPLGVMKKLYYDYGSMQYDPENYNPGDPKRGDQRAILADLLNITGSDNGYFGGKYRKPFWSDTMTDLFERGGIVEFFKSALLEEGFTKT
jgi:hypothetical protein